MVRRPENFSWHHLGIEIDAIAGERSTRPTELLEAQPSLHICPGQAPGRALLLRERDRRRRHGGDIMYLYPQRSRLPTGIGIPRSGARVRRIVYAAAAARRRFDRRSVYKWLLSGQRGLHWFTPFPAIMRGFAYISEARRYPAELVTPIALFCRIPGYCSLLPHLVSCLRSLRCISSWSGWTVLTPKKIG